MRRPAALALLVIALAAGSAPAQDGAGPKKAPPGPPGTKCPNCGHINPQGEEARNLLLNPGAESGRGDVPSVWVAAAGPARPDGPRMTRSTDQAHSGRAALAIAYDGPTDRPVAFNWAQPLAEVPDGRSIRVRAWIKAEGADSVNVCIQCWSDKEDMLAFGSTPVFRGEQGWTEARSGLVVIPPGTARVVVRAALTGRGKAWFDDLAVLEEGEPSGRDVDPSPMTYIKRLTEADIKRLTAAPAVEPPAVDDALARAAGSRIVRALPIAKDCTVLAYLPDWNHGRVDWIAVANNNGGTKGGVRSLVGLPELTAEDVVPDGRRFVLALYSRKTTVGEGASPIEAVELTSGWPESTSWADAPEASPSPFASAVVVPGEGWKLFDVTPLVRKWAASGANGRGLMLRFAREDVGTGGKWSGYEFFSREGPDGRRPMLLVVDPAGR